MRHCSPPPLVFKVSTRFGYGVAASFSGRAGEMMMPPPHTWGGWKQPIRLSEEGWWGRSFGNARFSPQPTVRRAHATFPAGTTLVTSSGSCECQQSDRFVLQQWRSPVACMDFRSLVTLLSYLFRIYHDMMFAQGNHAPAVTPTQTAEIQYQVRRLSSHPSISVFDGCNECNGHG